MSYAADTSPSGLEKAARQQNASLQEDKMGSPKGISGTYMDAQFSPIGMDYIQNSIINKPAMPTPSGSTADFQRMKP